MNEKPTLNGSWLTLCGVLVAMSAATSCVPVDSSGRIGGLSGAATPQDRVSYPLAEGESCLPTHQLGDDGWCYPSIFMDPPAEGNVDSEGIPEESL